MQWNRLSITNLFTKLLSIDLRFAFCVALAWQLGMTIVALIMSPESFHVNPFYHTIQWDSIWYLRIIADQYQNQLGTPVFYPLFPLIVGAVDILTFRLLNYETIGFFINTVCTSLALAGLIAIAREFVPAKYSRLSVLFLLASPAAYFLHLFYTEALFMAIGFWAYYFTLKKRWLLVGILLGFLTATRLPSILVVILCFLEYLRSYDYSKKALNQNMLAFLLAPVGFMVYGLYLLIVRSDFLLMFHAINEVSNWSYHVFNPNFIGTILQNVYETSLAFIDLSRLNDYVIVNKFIPLVSLALLLACSVYLIFKYRGRGFPLGVSGFAAIALFSLNNNLTSAHRYTVPCITIYIALVLLWAKKPMWRWRIIFLVICMLVLQLILLFYLYNGIFSG